MLLSSFFTAHLNSLCHVLIVGVVSLSCWFFLFALWVSFTSSKTTVSALLLWFLCHMTASPELDYPTQTRCVRREFPPSPRITSAVLPSAAHSLSGAQLHAHVWAEASRFLRLVEYGDDLFRCSASILLQVSDLLSTSFPPGTVLLPLAELLCPGRWDSLACLALGWPKGDVDSHLLFSSRAAPEDTCLQGQGRGGAVPVAGSQPGSGTLSSACPW